MCVQKRIALVHFAWVGCYSWPSSHCEARFSWVLFIIMSSLTLCVATALTSFSNVDWFSRQHRCTKLLKEDCFLTIFFYRAQQPCESRGGRSGIPIPNGQSGLCGHKAAVKMRKTGFSPASSDTVWLLCVWTWACSSRETFDAFPAYAKTWIELIFAPTLLQIKSEVFWVLIFLVMITCFELSMFDVLVLFLKS